MTHGPTDPLVLVWLPEATADKLRQVARERDMTVQRTAAVLLSDALERDRPLTHSKEVDR